MFKWPVRGVSAVFGLLVGLGPTVGKGQETEIVMALPALTLTFRSAFVVISRSVETTSISLIERINSVFPALKGPVITIFTVCIGCSLFQCNVPGGFR